MFLQFQNFIVKCQLITDQLFFRRTQDFLFVNVHFFRGSHLSYNFNPSSDLFLDFNLTPNRKLLRFLLFLHLQSPSQNVSMINSIISFAFKTHLAHVTYERRWILLLYLVLYLFHYAVFIWTENLTSVFQLIRNDWHFFNFSLSKRLF